MYVYMSFLSLIGIFDWDVYLKECNAVAAPASWFKQVIINFYIKCVSF